MGLQTELRQRWLSLEAMRHWVGLTLSSTGDLLGKRLSCPCITSHCSSEKKARSKDPQGESPTLEKDAGHREGGEQLGPEGLPRPWVETIRSLDFPRGPHHVLCPTATSLLPKLESTMAPEDHYHQLMSALSEASSFEETQRLYHLGIPSHGMCHPHGRRSDFK